MSFYAPAPRAAVGTFDLGRAADLAARIAARCGVAAPLVTRGHDARDPRRLGWYAPRSRVVNLRCRDDELVDVLLHEFRHYLDDLEGRPGGPNAHPAAFWGRLETLEDACWDLRQRA